MRCFFFYISVHFLYLLILLLIFDVQNSSNQIGIPIGNYTSQFFANIYLNELDQFVKRTLKVKYYVRYMDDFILLAKTKGECIKLNTILCLNSWLGHSSHCNSFKLQNKILNNCNFLITNKTYENIEKDLICLIENYSKKAF